MSFARWYMSANCSLAKAAKIDHSQHSLPKLWRPQEWVSPQMKEDLTPAAWWKNVLGC